VHLPRNIAVLLWLSVIGPLAVGQDSNVKLRGVASMVYVGQKVSNFYETENPGLRVDVNIIESVQGLPQGNGSIWQHIGPLSAPERNSLHGRFGSAPAQVPVGVEAVLVILNKSNPITDLSVEQLRAIYTGKIANWKAIGGPDRRIHLYGTESAVGGDMFFQDSILQGDNFDDSMQAYSNPKETASAVATDVDGIGLTSMSGESSVKYPRLRRTPSSPGIDGTSENVRNLSYPLSSHLYWSFPKEYSPAVEHLVEFAFSPRGQMAIEASGCYPLNPNERIRGMVALSQSK